ncbi:MAG: GNAT family N-acetyltransferase [Mesorhizobium sp.]|nr:MAG: GNAT family N-acetyltransferase [Mesorhizobium sp.]TIQ70058.1 MAG: GNAT family N-acetyltransferase [Mesorhizobium sp.]
MPAKEIRQDGMEIRHANPADIPSLAHLMTELGYPTSAEEMTSRMALIRSRTDHAIFVADENGIVTGMIGVSISPSLYQSDPQGAIVALVVSSDFRGKGIGAFLVERGESWLRESGAKYVTVKPSIRREDAHRLYARLGYEHSGLRFSKNLI